MVLTKRPEVARRYLLDKPVLPNVWLGVSTENQQTAEERIPVLLATPAALRWNSAEPLLEALDLRLDLLLGLDWVVMGGESGGDARPCNLERFPHHHTPMRPGTRARVSKAAWRQRLRQDFLSVGAGAAAPQRR